MEQLSPSPSASVELPSVESVHAARARIAPHIMRTPLVRLNLPKDYVPPARVATSSSGSSSDAGAGEAEKPLEIYLKLENLQHTGCFKARGAFNALLSCAEGQVKTHGVITSSAGNFGQGLAWCSKNLGCHCTVVVPNTAPSTKLAGLKSHRAEVISVPFEEWWRTLEAGKYAGHESKKFIHPCADTDVIAGNGTIALEILEDLPDVDAVIIPYGGGGMCAGVGSVLKQLRPQVKVFPVEVETSTPLLTAVTSGKPTVCDHTPSFVDGIGGKTILREMWPLVTSVMTRPVTVSLDDVVQAIKAMVEGNNVIAEGAGGAPVAAAMKGLAGGGKVVAVVSGGNIDVATLATVLQGQVPKVAKATEGNGSGQGEAPKVAKATEENGSGHCAD